MSCKHQEDGEYDLGCPACEIAWHIEADYWARRYAIERAERRDIRENVNRETGAHDAYDRDDPKRFGPGGHW